MNLDLSDVEESLADIQAIGLGTRAEKGCLFYAVALDDAPAGRIVVIEQGRDQVSLTAHLEGPQTISFQKWMNRAKIDVL